MFGILEAILPMMIFAGFVLVLGMFLYAAVRGIRQWSKNNASPRLSVPATVRVKRTNTTHSMHTAGNGAHHTSTSTYYYATFEFESGDRQEFSVTGSEYGMLAEGDRGTLSFQGTRYLGFTREKQS